VVVVGDMVADEYIVGTPARISREAPVVILEFKERQLVPGGATNVAVNLRALGAAVRVIGVVGDDQAGRELTAALQQRGIDTAGLIIDPDRPTSTKTRIMGGGVQVVQQQMVRIDRVDSSPLDGAPKRAVLEVVEAMLHDATAMILSDYEHGVIDPEVIGICLAAAAREGIISTVDAHGDLYRFRGVTLATPNQPEAEAMLGRAMRDAAELRSGGRELLDGMAARGLLITRGSLGMAVLDREGLFLELPPFHIAEVRDATGAGDTVAAVATLALAGGAALWEAAVLSNAAGALVVRKLGAATTSPEELRQVFATVR
jgi:rfaE bifunctional protein kinase chain/domain